MGVESDFVHNFVVLILFMGLCKEGHACVRYEHLTCGDGYARWQFCRPNTVDTVIRSVHLDLRHPNRYCRKKIHGIEEFNYGMTESRNRMWVFDYCYGTFLVCLDTDPNHPSTIKSASSTVTTSSSVLLNSTLFNSDKFESAITTRTTSTTTTLGDLLKTSTQENPKAEKQQWVSNKTSETQDINQTIQQNGHDDKDTKRPMLLPRAPVVDHVTSSIPDTGEDVALNGNDDVMWVGAVGKDQGTAEKSSKKATALDPALKTLIMTAIITGGAVLMFLVILTTIVVLKCNRKDGEYGPSSSYNARGTKTSTSQLLETNVENSVYDVIPYDVVTGTPKVNKSSVQRNVRSAYDHQPQLTDENGKIIIKDSTAEAKSNVDGNGNDVETPENPYDHIVSTFKPVVLYQGTYNKVCIERTPSETTDSGVQTESSPSDIENHNYTKLIACDNKVLKKVKEDTCARNRNTL